MKAVRNTTARIFSKRDSVSLEIEIQCIPFDGKVHIEFTKIHAVACIDDSITKLALHTSRALDLVDVGAGWTHVADVTC